MSSSPQREPAQAPLPSIDGLKLKSFQYVMSRLLRDIVSASGSVRPAFVMRIRLSQKSGTMNAFFVMRILLEMRDPIATESRMRKPSKQNTKYSKTCWRGWLLAFTVSGITHPGYGDDSAHTPPPAVRYMQVTTTLARDRWESIQALHREGYASQQELQKSELAYHNSLAGLEVVVAHSTVPNAPPHSEPPFAIALSSSTESNDNAAEGTPPAPLQKILVHLPGLSRHPATRRFSTIRLEGIDLINPESVSEDFTISATPRRNVIEKQIAVQEELIRRLEKIKHDSASPTKERQLAQLRLEQLRAERDMTLPLTVVSVADTQPDTPTPVTFQAPLPGTPDSEIQQAIQVANDSVDQASNAVQHHKGTFIEHSRRLKKLIAISDNPYANHREAEREQLLLDASSASLNHARESLQCRQAELRYLQAIAAAQENSSRDPHLHDAVLDLMRNHSNRSSAVAEWTAKSKYLEWKHAAIRSLFAEGHASWWETNQTELALAEAEAARTQADNQLAVAKRTLAILEKALTR